MTRSDSPKPTAMPKRNLIDAFLDAGATVPSSARHATASIRKSADLADTSTSTNDHIALDAKAKNINADAEIVTEGEHLKPGDVDFEAIWAGSDLDRNDTTGVGVSAPHDKRHSRGKSTSARNNPSQGSIASNRSVGPIEAAGKGISEKIASKGEAVDGKRHGGDSRDVGKTETTTHAAMPVEATHTTQAKAAVKGSKGRLQRQAKQTALGKLKAKHSELSSSESDDDETDDRDEDANFVAPTKSVKKPSDGGRKSKQLPTPVTNGNQSKGTAGSKSQGKLKSVKPQHSNTTTIAKKSRKNNTSTGDTPAPSIQGSKTGTAVAQAKKNRTKEAEPTQSPEVHQETGTTMAGRSEQHKSNDKLSSKKPGALKRPARSFSRGRRPQRETPYEFSWGTPGTRKKGRSESKASIASTARAGPTRQRMQSESVKERVDRANRDLQLPSTSRRPFPKAAKDTDRPRKPSEPKRKHGDLQPTVMSPRKGDVQQSQGHVAPSERSNHVTETEMQDLNTRGRPTTSRQKPGSSQVQAITIEPDSRSGSSSSPSPRRPTNARLNVTAQAASDRKITERPQTPAMMPSSPPGSGKESIHTLAHNKPTIISFDRHGPRNQGFSSASKNPGSAVSSKVLVDYRSAKAGTPGDYAKTTGLATQLFPPSSQHVVKVRKQVANTAERSNVSVGDEDVLDAFTKIGKNKARTSLFQKPSNAVKELGQDDEDNGFAVIDDFEGTTLINDDEPAPAPKQATASQIAMPPPNVVTMEKKKSSKTIDDSVQVHKKSDMKAKPVALEDTPRPVPAKKAASRSKANDSQQPVPSDKAVSRPTDDEVHEVETHKKVKKTLATKHALQWGQMEVDTVAQPSQQIRKRGPTELQAGSPTKKVRVSKENTLLVHDPRSMRVRETTESDNVQTTHHVKRLDRRKSGPSRRTTQGSQGVDILGSPYPKDLEVPTQTTALEVFSQQAQLSLDQMASSDAAVTGRLNLEAVPRMIPTAKAGLVSSNGKPIPAAPYESSEAVTSIASGHFAEQLLIARPVLTSEENPFTSSRALDPTDGNGIVTAKFRAALRQRGIDLNDRSPASRRDEREDEPVDDVEETLVEPVTETRQTSRHDEREDEPVDDAEETLVEPVTETRQTSGHDANSPGGSETSGASSPDAAAKVLEDVGDWRNSLKPYQTHLFDSLVIAAHKLVRHMVDQETADRTMVADYRRRGEIIVTELQRAHAKEYHQYTHNVQGWKKQAADELAAQSRRLKQVMRDVEKARAERKKAQAARNEFDGVLEGLVAGLD
jgi:hypothetical protein